MTQEERENILDIKNLELGYGKNILGENINLQIPKGKITSIIGKSGSGKSSLLSILSGINRYKKEIYFLMEESLKNKGERDTTRYRDSISKSSKSIYNL